MHSANAGTDAPSAVWDVLDQLVDDVAAQSRADTLPESFYGELLRRACEALAAPGGSVWEYEGSAIHPFAHYHGSSPAAPANEAAESELARLVDAVARRREECWIQPGGRLTVADTATPPHNPLEVALSICPFAVDGRALGVLVIEHRSDVLPDARHAALRVLATLAELTADYHRSRQRRLWQARAAATDELESLLATLYRDLNVRDAAYAAANDGRRWIGCDRVSVLVFDGRRAAAVAVSGVDLLDRRADQIRGLERLAATTARLGETLRFPDDSANLSPEVSQALAGYVDVAHPTELVVVPLRVAASANQSAASREPPDTEQSILGALVVERFTGLSGGEEAGRRLDVLVRHAAAALAKAREVESIPGSRLWRRLRVARAGFRRRRRAALVWGGLIAILAAVPFFIPAEYTIEARGTLEPKLRRDIFMPADAIVSEVNASHGARVAAGDTLIRLYQPELARERARVTGEIATTTARLATIAALLGAGRQDPDGLTLQELSAEQKQLEPKLKALHAEAELLSRQEAELNVAAPFAGTVTTWDAERLLAGRPVTQGTRLLSLADTAGPWELELRVADRHMAALAESRRELGAGLMVEFITAADPAAKHLGRLDRAAQTATTDAERHTTVAVTAEINIADLPADQRRPGAAVTAKIRCGDGRLGVVWCRDLVQFVRSNILF